ncbi:hypothetical protein [Phytoactinopolyspora mesophila]|uniref:Uncharacterized protein n=1 Tax=Phytoactinopolyspora mesophila TaxID=2650750 RepID=A0A7K3M6A3_9ACTN|nr:hypothetical protein [Phytoactinopolyspora mesophila]NDL58843.1 hypothetical protein [Phytoactinopolyspora mesophila]
MGDDSLRRGEAQQLLAIYLNDHLAGATAGTRRMREVARIMQESQFGPELATLADEIASERAELESMMNSLGIPVRRYKIQLSVAAELAGRLKPNGRLVRRSPLSTLVELEVMRLGIEGKASGWRTLRSIAENDQRLSARRLDELSDRAEKQAQRVEELRKRTAEAIFGHMSRR